MEMTRRNISLAEFIEVIKKAKQETLFDLSSFDAPDLRSPDSMLGIQLQCRDDEDAYRVIGHDFYQLFIRFNQGLMEYMKERSGWLLEDDEPDKESARDKLFWEVTKYTKIGDAVCRMYEAYFSLDCELLAVRWSCHIDPSQDSVFPDHHLFQWYPERYINFSDAEHYLRNSKDQLYFAANIELPYQPGDILHIDAAPFGKPFYVVYCAETDEDPDCVLWTKEEYGYYRHDHPCMYISEDRNGLDITNLTVWGFTDYISFPYAPLDRIMVVESCDNPLLMKVSSSLKEDPSLFYVWIQNWRNNNG